MPDDEEVIETDAGEAGTAERASSAKKFEGLEAFVPLAPTDEQLDERQRRMNVFRKEAGPEERTDRSAVGEDDVVDVPPTECDAAPEDDGTPLERPREEEPEV